MKKFYSDFEELFSKWVINELILNQNERFLSKKINFGDKN
jgi:hypothetical protein